MIGNRIPWIALGLALAVASADKARSEIHPGTFVAPIHGAAVRLGPCAEGPLCVTLLSGVLAAPAGAVLRGTLDGPAATWLRFVDDAPEILSCDVPGCAAPRWTRLVRVEPDLGHLARLTRF